MTKTQKVIGAAEWLGDIVKAVRNVSAEYQHIVLTAAEICRNVRQAVATKVEMMNAGRLQPLDRETYDGARYEMLQILTGINPREKSLTPEQKLQLKQANRTLTGGDRWGFGVFNPSAKRRAQVAGSKANKTRKANKAHGTKVKSAVHAALAKAIAAALKRGVTHVQLLDAIKALPAAK